MKGIPSHQARTKARPVHAARSRLGITIPKVKQSLERGLNPGVRAVEEIKADSELGDIKAEEFKDALIVDETNPGPSRRLFVVDKNESKNVPKTIQIMVRL